MAEYLDDFLAVEHLFNIAVYGADSVLLFSESFV